MADNDKAFDGMEFISGLPVLGNATFTIVVCPFCMAELQQDKEDRMSSTSPITIWVENGINLMTTHDPECPKVGKAMP